MSPSGSAPEEAESRLIAGRYRLTEPLGSGAMGTVWAGYDEVLHRSVAIKELKVPPGVPEGEMVAMRERMMREARTLGGLSHPNVITLYDVVAVDGDPFVVMELLPSRDLSKVIGAQGKLSAAEAATVGHAMASALQAAHRAGITHRDVKPGNVLVAEDGRIKLTDFGIARKRDDVTMTQTGLVLGSPAYIAPEVAAGQPVTPAADLWGLGATLFAALEARPPYDVEGDPVKTVTAVVHAEVPRVSMGGPLADVIAALMVKDPERRLGLADVKRRLRPLVDDPEDPVFPGSPEAFIPPPDTSGRVIGETDSGGSAAPAQYNSYGATTTGTSAPRRWNTSRPDGTPAPLAAEPGPMPPPPAPPRPSDGYGTQGTGYPAQGTQGGYPQGTQGGYGRPSWQPTGSVPSRPPIARSAPPQTRAQAGLSGKMLVPLILAGMVAVLVGAGFGWSTIRVLVGQSSLTTDLVSPASGAGVTLKAYTDNAPGGLGFTVKTPDTWEQYRVAPQGNGSASVRFVSPDGSRELRVDKIVGSRTKPATTTDFTNLLTPSGMGVDKVTVESSSGAQVTYRSERTGPQGVSSRFGYAQLTKAGDDMWVAQLIVPATQADDPARDLFSKMVSGFTP